MARHQCLSSASETYCIAAVDVAMQPDHEPATVHRLNVKLVREHMRELRGPDIDRAARTVAHLDALAKGKHDFW